MAHNSNKRVIPTYVKEERILLVSTRIHIILFGEHSPSDYGFKPGTATKLPADQFCDPSTWKGLGGWQFELESQKKFRVQIIHVEMNNFEIKVQTPDLYTNHTVQTVKCKAHDLPKELIKIRNQRIPGADKCKSQSSSDPQKP